MENINSNLHDCKHCNETGTCTTGKDGSSCVGCIKYHDLKASGSYTGLSCGVCGGLGKGEPRTERINKRIRPFLAILLLTCLICFCFILALNKNPNFSTFLAFASTLSASIVTYYFTNNKK